MSPGERELGRHHHGEGSGAVRKNLQQLVQLRWIASLGQIVTILVAYSVFGIALPVDEMLLVVAVLVLFNGFSLLRLRLRHPVSHAELFMALLVDVGLLTVQLYLSGGTSNPFVFVYLLQVTLAAVLLPPAPTWTIVAFTAMCFAGLALSSPPLVLPGDLHQGLASPYVLGLLVCFVVNAALLVVFISRISHNLRERDTRLAALRQRAAEEEHIVRMGLLASGAAHELGTPLATLAVILGDWERVPVVRDSHDLAQDVAEMQAQVQRCKSIVSGILLSAGEARGELLAETSVHVFLDTLVAQWRQSRPGTRLRYENRFGEDLDIISDTALQQMIGNVLDNAWEASPKGQRLDVTREGDVLVLAVSDQGPGFDAAMLSRLGKPYQSSKGRPGGGLGLFLAVNVLRTLGGTISARNLPTGGAVVTLRLPLAALTPGHTAHVPESAVVSGV